MVVDRREGGGSGRRSYEGACEVHAGGAGGGAVEPCRPFEAEETVAVHCGDVV